MYSLLSSRAVQDLKLVPLVFDALALRRTRDEVFALLDRLSVIHEARCPLSARDLGVDGGE